MNIIIQKAFGERVSTHKLMKNVSRGGMAILLSTSSNRHIHCCDLSGRDEIYHQHNNNAKFMMHSERKERQ